jgi:S-formylglutathione hydrolase FrmB
MPEVQRSFYADRVGGINYWAWLSEELPAFAESRFPISDQPRDRYVAGLSMGGYGAARWLLTHPRTFAAGASFSGVLDVGLLLEPGSLDRDWRPATDPLREAFGTRSDFTDSPADLFALASHLDPKSLPPFTIDCGTADHLYEGNLNFGRHLESLGVPCSATWHADRSHTWDYWDERIAVFIETISAARASASIT